MTTARKLQSSRLIIGMIAPVLSLTISSHSFAGDSAAASAMAGIYGPLVVADAHSYRHCHNLSKRTYCHKADRLPQNWPPHTDTPHRSGYETDRRRDCPAGSRRCDSNNRYEKG
jgi:hypothetical protein